MRNITIGLNVPNNNFVYNTYKQKTNILNIIFRPSMDFNYIDKYFPESSETDKLASKLYTLLEL